MVAGVKSRAPEREAFGYVTWSNHLNPEANELALKRQQAVRAAFPGTQRLETDWRERMEDMVWALMNSPEFVFVP